MSQVFKMLSESEYNELNSKMDKILDHFENNGTGTPNKKWLTEKEAQEVTGKKATTLWKMRTKGLLEYTKINNRVFYSRAGIEALLEENKQEAYAIKNKR